MRPSVGRAAGALLVGVAMGTAYLALAFVGRSVGVLPGRPLYDGFAPPPPYRWVSPPPALAADNQEPEGVIYPLSLTPQGSGVAAVSTPDLQVSLVFQEGAIAGSAGQTGIQVEVKPEDPGLFGAAPSGLELRGNVYQVSTTYQPDGTVAQPFDPAVQVAMAYPAPLNPAGERREILYSADGRAWARLETIDSPAQHKAGADIPGPGYVAVGGPVGSASGEGDEGLGRFLLPGIIILAGLLALLFAYYLWSGRSTPMQGTGPGRDGKGGPSANGSRR